MRLDRNTGDGQGKYGLVLLRKLSEMDDNSRNDAAEALRTLIRLGVFEYSGPAGSVNEFFVLRLRDEYSQYALRAYAAQAVNHDMEYASDVFALADRAGPASPFCKKPD